MENGRKPKYVITGDEKRPLLYADRLCSGWYQVMVKYDENESESTGEKSACNLCLRQLRSGCLSGRDIKSIDLH